MSTEQDQTSGGLSRVEVSPEGQTPGSSTGQDGYLHRALIAGGAAGIPVGWLLAYLAPMPYLLGLFFFLVLGMLAGAIMCRFARGGAPFPRERLSRLSLIVAVVIWCTVLVMEYRWFPDAAAREAVRMSLTSKMNEAQVEAFRQRVRVAADEQLQTRYRPGSLPGYLRWAATSGTMELPRAGSDQPVQYKNVQPPRAWIIRVLASLALLIFAVDSLFSTLAPRKAADGEATVEQDDAPKE